MNAPVTIPSLCGMDTLLDAITSPAPSQNVVIAGELSDPVYGNAFRNALDGLCAGAHSIQPQIKIDWSVSKEENLRRAMAGVNSAWAVSK